MLSGSVKPVSALSDWEGKQMAECGALRRGGLAPAATAAPCLQPEEKHHGSCLRASFASRYPRGVAFYGPVHGLLWVISAITVLEWAPAEGLWWGRRMEGHASPARPSSWLRWPAANFWVAAPIQGCVCLHCEAWPSLCSQCQCPALMRPGGRARFHHVNTSFFCCL